MTLSEYAPFGYTSNFNALHNSLAIEFSSSMIYVECDAQACSTKWKRRNQRESLHNVRGSLVIANPDMLDTRINGSPKARAEKIVIRRVSS